jgi:predicted nucleic acid-binding protein
VSYLLDTNVISELARPTPDPAVVRWTSERDHVDISVITIEEIMLGLTWKPAARVEAFFEKFVTTFCRVHAVSSAIAQHAGVMRGQLAARGQSREPADMLIAATASAHGLTLVTRNERDFEGCGVSVVNPFSR